VRNLSDITIPIADNEKRNLVITGKNGSGKTSLLNAMIHNIGYLIEKGDFGELEKHKKSHEILLNKAIEGGELNSIENHENEIKRIDSLALAAKAGVGLDFNLNSNSLKAYFEKNEFIVAAYNANRKFSAQIPAHVENVELKEIYLPNEAPRTELVKYLLDLKMKEALSQTSGKTDVANTIHTWFEKFDGMLKTVFEDDTTKLVFDEESFKFTIQQDGKEPFDFNTLSDGYAAVLDIVVDLMMRMEKKSKRSFVFNMPGIVFIDEIETHLHIELQRNVMTILETFFPNIQFVVTTHSPFIISSMDNAVIYDLENKTLVKDGLSNVPYDGIVEGYFGADALSNKLREKFERYKALVKKDTITDADIEEITKLEMYLEEIPDYLAMGLSTEYHKLKLEFSARGDL
ncbi:AAA family ATPase, partial [Pseudobutyrivibrio sp.]